MSRAAVLFTAFSTVAGLIGCGDDQRIASAPVVVAQDLVAVGDPPLPTATSPSVPELDITGPASVPPDISAVRVSPPTTTTTTLPPVPTGLWGQPFAPPGLSNCDEMNFYRLQWGLPERFGDYPRSGPRSKWGLGWRESNCRNEEGVKTYCCYGWWQLYFTLHARDAHMSKVYARCEVYSIWDYNGDEPLDKQKMACATAGLYALNGYSPWAL